MMSTASAPTSAVAVSFAIMKNHVVVVQATKPVFCTVSKANCVATRSRTDILDLQRCRIAQAVLERLRRALRLSGPVVADFVLYRLRCRCRRGLRARQDRPHHDDTDDAEASNPEPLLYPRRCSLRPCDRARPAIRAGLGLRANAASAFAASDQAHAAMSSAAAVTNLGTRAVALAARARLLPRRLSRSLATTLAT